MAVDVNAAADDGFIVRHVEMEMCEGIQAAPFLYQFLPTSAVE